MPMLTKSYSAGGFGAIRPPTSLLLVRGSKTKCVVEPCIVNAHFSLDLHDHADEAGLHPYVHMGMAAVILRRVCQPDIRRAHTKNENDSRPAMTEISAQAHGEMQHDSVRAEGHQQDNPATEEGRDALAFARPVSLDDFPEDAPELVSISNDTLADTTYVEAISEEEDDEDDDEEDDSDSDASDSDSDCSSEADTDSSSNCLKAKPSQSSFFYRPPLRRSPLSRSSDGLHHHGVYEGYRCKIPGCDFAASTEGHVRHHMTTASHCHLLELLDQDEQA